MIIEVLLKKNSSITTRDVMDDAAGISMEKRPLLPVGAQPGGDLFIILSRYDNKKKAQPALIPEKGFSVTLIMHSLIKCKFERTFVTFQHNYPVDIKGSRCFKAP